MKFAAWEAKRHIERNYLTALKKLGRFLSALIDGLADPGAIEDRLNQISESEQLDTWANAVAKRMVTHTLEENARTWRQAAAKSSEGRAIYNSLQHEMQGSIGERVRQLIDENAKYITTVPQEVALQIVRHTQTQAFSDNRETYKTETFQQLVGNMVESHAKVISRTETAKAMSALTQARAEALGHDWYIWHTSEDGRVRDSHRLMDDVLCRYSDQPAPEELNGERSAGHYGPGNIYNCRCYAEPVIIWNDISWPHDVYADGKINRMTKAEFQKQFGGTAA